MKNHLTRRGNGYTTSRNRIIPPSIVKDAAAFWSRVANAMSGDADICWPWTGSFFDSGNGYGEFRDFGAHRIAYFLHYEVQPGKLLVLHSCDNPPCCNPYHLSLGTHDDNAKDRETKGRGGEGRGGYRRQPGQSVTKLCQEQVNEIKNSRETARSLAEKYGVHVHSIYNIWQGRTWKDVRPE